MLLFLAIAAGSPTVTTTASEEALSSSTPHRVLKLTLNEFSILNVSEMDGLLKYGGSGEFKLSMARERTNEVVWTVTVENSRLMELLGIFVGEKTMKLIQSLDLNNLDPNQKIALEAIKSLSKKLEEAQKNPVWDSVKLSGTISQQGTNWALQAKEGSFKVVGTKTAALNGWSGRPIVADGFVKVPGEFELASFMDKRTNTLEMFVMSFCPFGTKAEANLYAYLSRTNAIAKPSLEIHYLFYTQKKEGKEVFVSLHGEDEVVEDLVQIVIRDQFGLLLEPYLRLRASSGMVNWRKLAEQIGIGKDIIAQIETTITAQREMLIQREHDYVTGRYGITDGSPTYVWESERVADLRSVEAFKGLENFTKEGCTQ